MLILKTHDLISKFVSANSYLSNQMLNTAKFKKYNNCILLKEIVKNLHAYTSI